VLLDEILHDEAAIVLLRARSAEDVLVELAGALAEQTGLDGVGILAGLLEREALGSTALGHGLAVPHTKADIQGSRGVLALAPHGIEFDAPDGVPVRVFVGLVSSMQPGQHLQALAAVGRAFADPTLLERMLACPSPADVLALVRQKK
jgi:PTS system nitrogen regulatory IIA component